MSYTTIPTRRARRGFGDSATPVPASVAALCAQYGGVIGYTESGFTFKVDCGSGRSCSGGAEQATQCVQSGGHITAQPGAAPPPPPCPEAYHGTDAIAGVHGPMGVPLYNVPPLTICRNIPPGDEQLVQICNMSRDPGYCYFAVKYNKAWKNRGSAESVAAWRSWYNGRLADLTTPAPFPGAAPRPPSYKTQVTVPGLFLRPEGSLPPGTVLAPDAGQPAASGGIPTWAYVAGAAVVLLGVGYLVMSKKAEPAPAAAAPRKAAA